MTQMQYDSKGNYIWAFHFHHGILAEPLPEPFETRQKFIKSDKNPEEVNVRLDRFKLIKGPMPPGIDAAWNAYTKTYDTAKYEAVKPVFISPWLETIHRQQCKNCPWNGKTLFPNKKD